METSTSSARVPVLPIDSGRGFTVREATPADYDQTRAHIVRILVEDFKTGYMPQYHWDLDDMPATYQANRRQALFVAVDHASGAIVGTVGVESPAPLSRPRGASSATRVATTPSISTLTLPCLGLNRSGVRWRPLRSSTAGVRKVRRSRMRSILSWQCCQRTPRQRARRRAC
jgi:hypothetical protein